MYVEFGNRNAIEGFTEGDDPEVRFRDVEGERVTRLTFPEEIGLQEAFSNALAAASHHIQADAAPIWIESDSDGLLALLLEHYGIPPKKNKRPASWGKKDD